MTTERKAECIGGPICGAVISAPCCQEYYLPIQEEPTYTPFLGDDFVEWSPRKVHVYKLGGRGNFIYAGIAQV